MIRGGNAVSLCLCHIGEVSKGLPYDTELGILVVE